MQKGKITMKIILLISALTLCYSSAMAQGIIFQKGYVKKDGSYVSPVYKTKSDNKMYNNYSTQGNVNPFTGKAGTKRDTQLYPNYNTYKPLKSESTPYKPFKPYKPKKY